MPRQTDPDERVYELQCLLTEALTSMDDLSPEEQAMHVLDVFMKSDLANDEVRTWYLAQEAAERATEN
jgi:hypothetical protein